MYRLKKGFRINRPLHYRVYIFCSLLIADERFKEDVKISDLIDSNVV